jgi:hypothetical protein
MNPANHEVREAQWQGRTRYYYVMPYEGHNIWGATAGMIRALRARLHGDDGEGAMIGDPAARDGGPA